ncbi:MAG TPA: PHP domain-containing protein, partial [Thermomicrobiales bacterium]|nr:PHP domain-containing protein [Thermomicrobiales bacterium]
MRRLRRKFPRFSELDAMACNVEHHVHTKWTDGKPTVAEALAVARDRGLRSIAITEHVRHEGSDWFHAFAVEVRAVGRSVDPMQVLVGCEAKALDTAGGLDVSEAILDQCDIVLGSVHRWPASGGGLVNFAELPQEDFAELETSYALGLLKNPDIDVLAHPGGMYQRRFGKLPDPLMRRLVEAAHASGIAIEISTSYLQDVPAFIDLVREIDPYVSIGSDAHNVDAIGT